MSDQSANDRLSVDEWRAIHREEGRRINPDTAEVFWTYGQIADPYGFGNLPPGYECLGPLHFARRPGSEIWVEFGDLPQATLDALRERMKRGAIPLPGEAIF